jgi:hypothetical protein
LNQQRPKVFNYRSARDSSSQNVANRGEKTSPEDKTPGWHQKISNIINYFIAALLLAGIVYMTMLNPKAQVKVSGQKVYPRDRTSYEQDIDSRLKSSIFYRSKLTFDGNSLTDDIRSDFPEVNDVNISISPFRHRPVVEVTLAKPTAKLVTPTNVYVLDEEGRALFEQKDASSDLNVGSLLTINDNSGQEIALGKPALSEHQISYIREVIGQTEAKKMRPKSFTLSSGGTAVNVRFEGLGYYVKFNFYADPRQSSGAFLALQAQLKRDAVQPSRYIDLRIPEKAFVR